MLLAINRRYNTNKLCCLLLLTNRFIYGKFSRHATTMFITAKKTFDNEQKKFIMKLNLFHYDSNGSHQVDYRTSIFTRLNIINDSVKDDIHRYTQNKQPNIHTESH